MKSTNLIQIKSIDNGFYRLTPAQAKLLSIDGELPKDGWEKRARPAAELNVLIQRIFWYRRTSFPEWRAVDRPIHDDAKCWIRKTRLSWHDGKPVEAGWVWAIHIWEPV